jgi:hypothetical protein
MTNTADVTGGKPMAVLLQSISGVSAVNPLVAFYEIHGGKREGLFFYFVPDTTRDIIKVKEAIKVYSAVKLSKDDEDEMLVSCVPCQLFHYFNEVCNVLQKRIREETPLIPFGQCGDVVVKIKTKNRNVELIISNLSELTSTTE